MAEQRISIGPLQSPTQNNIGKGHVIKSLSNDILK
jgi:hypothetical protein